MLSLKLPYTIVIQWSEIAHPKTSAISLWLCASLGVRSHIKNLIDTQHHTYSKTFIPVEAQKLLH
ncbi:hypothetical protein [Argonema antarcticum]|uniref:hypothetical protein n=1 Tax=Argonema antarcticum TaxID=2942763 RepID=UPI0020112A8C|nr:hypothetical protein [Argonema antarcticum]MCL1471633.1 hypothetical protein [Argonema antarcticum A004/B2]